MFTIPGILPRRSPSLRRGRRSARPVRKLAASSRRSAPRPCTYSDWQIVSGDTRISGRSANSAASRRLTCSGDHLFSSRSCTQPRSSSFPASLAVFGRRARTSARYCAAVARYNPVPELFRAISRLTVDAARPSSRAICRTPFRAATPTAISSRSATGRYRPGTGPGPSALTPPASANHRCARHVSPAADTASPSSRPARTPSQEPHPRIPRTRRPPAPSSTTTSTSANRCDDQLNPPALWHH